MTAKTTTVKATATKAPAAKTTKATKATASKIPSASPQAKEAAAAKAAKAPAAKVSKATASKPAEDLLSKHIAEVFSEVPKGTFLKARAITDAITKAYPKAEVRPSVHTVFARCRGSRLPEGITGQAVPCGAFKA